MEKFSHVPGVDSQKWLERRWMTLLCDRWATDKSVPIGEAWFNGIGVVNWQNVWVRASHIQQIMFPLCHQCKLNGSR